MQIDAATRRNLELTRSLAGGREGSLLAAIDRTVTGGGARLLETRLTAPSTDLRLIRARADAVEALPREPGPRARGPRDCCAGCPTSSGRCRGSRSTAAGRATSPRCATRWRRPAGLHALLAGELPEVLAAARAALAGHEALVGLLDAALVAEPPLLARDGGFVAPGYDAELDETRRLRDEGRGGGRRAAGRLRAADRGQRAEDPAQQRARLLHRDPGDARRADAEAAARRDLRAPPDHGERHPLHHAGAGRDRDEDPQRRRPCARDRAGGLRRPARRGARARRAARGGGEGAGRDRRRGGAGRPRARRGLGAAGGRRGPGLRGASAAGIRWSRRRSGARAAASSPTTASSAPTGRGRGRSGCSPGRTWPASRPSCGRTR